MEELQQQINDLIQEFNLFKRHDHSIAGGERLKLNSLSQSITEDYLILSSDVTTRDVSASTHGFAPKGTNWLASTGMTLTETLATDNTAFGLIVSKTAGENLVFGDVVYFKSDGKVWKSDANDSATYPAVGLAIATINANAAGNILLKGIARDDSWTWTIGGVLYLSITAGAMSQSQPTATNDAIQVLGVSHPNEDTIYWNPSIDYLTHI